MARQSYTPPRIGDPRDAATVNTALDQFELIAATNGIDTGNLREEGLDRDSFPATALYGRGFTPITFTSTANYSFPAAYASLDFATPLFRTGAITLAIDEVLEVNFRIQHITTDTLSGFPSGDTFRYRLRQSVSAVQTSVLGTTMRVRTSELTDGCVSIFGWFVGSLSLDWVEIQVQEDGGPTNGNVGFAQMYGRIFRRTDVLM